jgi:hypothetical protein
MLLPALRLHLAPGTQLAGKEPIDMRDVLARVARVLCPAGHGHDHVSKERHGGPAAAAYDPLAG